MGFGSGSDAGVESQTGGLAGSQIDLRPRRPGISPKPISLTSRMIPMSLASHISLRSTLDFGVDLLVA